MPAAKLPLALQLKAVETVLKDNYRFLSWLVWWILMFEILSGFGVLVIPFLMNEYIYIGGLLLLVLMKLLQKTPLCMLIKQPALLAASIHRSMFGLSQGKVKTGLRCAWEGAFRVLLSSLAFLSLCLQWSTLSLMCDELPSQSEAEVAQASGCILPTCHTSAGREALIAAEYGSGTNACIIKLQACHCTQWAGIHTNLCYSVGPIFCSTTLDGAPHALQRVNVVLCAVVAPPVWLVLYLCLLARNLDTDRLRSQIQAERQKMTSAASGSAGCMSKAWIILDIGFLALDVLLDVSCLSTLVQSKQYVPAACQATVLLLSLAQQLRFGVCAVGSAIRESLRVGYQTDILLRITQSEKLTESFLSLLIQGAAITTLSNAAATQFNISMFISMLGIVKAIYKQVHLDLAGLDTEADTTHCFSCHRDAVSPFRAEGQQGPSAKPPQSPAPSVWRNLYGRAH